TGRRRSTSSPGRRRSPSAGWTRHGTAASTWGSRSMTEPRTDSGPDRWFHRRGALARDGWESRVDASLPGWQHTGLDVAELSPGTELPLRGAGLERLVVPLAGSFSVRHGSTETRLAGRESVFAGPTDVLYLPAGTDATLS